MRSFFTLVVLLSLSMLLEAQSVQDDFEGSGTITSWYGDNCNMNINYTNPYSEGINTSSTVLEYHDVGGPYANVQFDINSNYDLTTKNSFSLKLYVPSSGLTGNQTNQISLKLQDKNLAQPWSTQSEIIKTIQLDQWQEVVFDFENDAYMNLDGNSPAPIERTDFNRVVIQVNGENNTDSVLAYIDDLLYFNTESSTPIYDNLVWSDEFDGTGAINGANWYHQTQLIAGNSWANGEVQHYTNREANSYVSNGTLKIKAIKETYTDQGYQKEYTSARLNSKFAFKYGRVEVRAKLPSVAGTWPAIWLLGKNINEDGTYWDNEGFDTDSWPFCGEIDIMEPNVAKTQTLATWHWDNGSGYQYNSNSVPLANTDASQNFHDYVLEWSPDTMKIYIDNTLVNQMPTVNPFNEEFFVLLNVAMGGSLGGPIAGSFTSDIMEIDYVRVYQESSLSTSKAKNNTFKFYPNPVENKFNIEFAQINNTKVLVEIIDFNGRIINQSEYINNGSKLTYDTRALNTGFYFMNLIYDDGSKSVMKFIKQ
jgi:beta-glucanase (GH16 family)